MSSGCIVIASDIKAHSEIIKNNINGVLYDLENPNLYKIYKDLCLDNKKISRISDEATRHIIKHNFIDNIVNLYFEDYKSINS